MQPLETAAVAVAGGRATPESCPILAGPARATFHDIVRHAGAFSMEFAAFLEGMSPARQAAWLHASLRSGNRLLQPWALEVLYAVALQRTARFGGLERQLGLSSRTLATRLRELEEDGLVERRVIAERPVRTEYVLTKSGRTTAALASLLFTHLTMAQPDRKALK